MRQQNGVHLCIWVRVIISEPANFGRRVAGQNWIADFFDTSVVATERIHDSVAFSTRGRITPEFDRRLNFACFIQRYEAMLLT